MLGILFATDSGPALMFLAGFYFFPALFSFISIIAKLANFKHRKWFLLRPTLVILVLVALIFIAQWSYQAALKNAISEAKTIESECRKILICPTHPEGWQANGARLNKQVVGGWLKYPLSYHYNATRFSIRIYQGPDLGAYISGGVDTPFSVTSYHE
ncbi:hypothetical protein A9Q79_02170 [Methylophaga sp. 42_25_T18]|nr:hypothetical protein A9Q79_02170 [Methylophaga sp. 42_25_T18]OUR88767.1 hypothetical protein A9Q92_02145 [Methylophaga sp. 42_8_T64]